MCIHANLRSLTVAELKGQKQELHLTAFRYMLTEPARDLERIASEPEGRARDRLRRDTTRSAAPAGPGPGPRAGPSRDKCSYPKERGFRGLWTPSLELPDDVSRIVLSS